ncbi:MAG: phage minor head protein [Alphaproteobacteria bacterium]
MPPVDHKPTQHYVEYVSRKTGVLPITKLSSLSDERLLDVVNAMVEFEKSIEGTIDVISFGKTGKYIWRTSHDEKVRTDHAARDGKVFDFANPPQGGNPREDYNCRCKAEPLPKGSLKEIFPTT